jgi:DNA-binding LytR/AlgR family response regulator
LDDELPSLAYLKALCEQIPYVDIVKAYNDPARFLAEIKSLAFDLCILDIEMPGHNGLDIARELAGKPVIFVTAYKEYAAEAFDLEAIDYIRKPIPRERLEKALSKAYQLVKDKDAEKNAKRLIQLNTSKGKALIYFDQVLYVTTADTDRRDKLMTLEHENLVLKNISFEKLLGMLPPTEFCQVNKKEIIALRIVQFFTHSEIITSLTEKNGKKKILALTDNFRSHFLSLVNE